MSQSEHLPQDFEGGFLKALLTDARANTMAIGAAAMVPLVAMVGGGIDASRFYMAQSRLQAACDAGALAARRAMDDDEFTTVHKAVGDGFFNENYPSGTFGLENLQHTYTGSDAGEVVGNATGKMPTSLMAMFGYEEFDLTVNCSADINISNTDIMFVLDVTGSMQCESTEASCSVNYPGAGSTVATSSKLYDLQEAAKSFYDTVEAATSPQAQVRYGFVPYSSNVNVGSAIQSENASWLATEADYQSRMPIFDEEWEETDRSRFFDYSNFGSEVFQEYEVDRRGDVSESFCIEYYNNIWPEKNDFVNWEEVGNFDYGTGTIDNVVQTGNTRISTGTGTVTQERGEPVYIYTPNNGIFTCQVGYDFYRRTADVSYEIEEELTRTFREYEYRERTFTLPASLYSTGTVTLETGNDVNTGGAVAHAWDGCIQEADTRALSDFSTVPSDAYDLNINLIPSNNQERWRPALPSLVHYRYSDGSNLNLGNSSSWQQGQLDSTEDKNTASQYLTTSGHYACPTQARRLAEMEETDFDNYVDSLRAWGATYHDTGMIWGARFLSPNGIFQSANTTAPNGDAISRHIVFMTDGTQATQRAVYGLYGIEWWDRNVTTDGSQSSMSTNHAERFQAACRAARNENISVWVVAFGTTLTQNLIDCATPGRSYSASDSEALSDAFEEIAEKIAALRLTA